MTILNDARRALDRADAFAAEVDKSEPIKEAPLPLQRELPEPEPFPIDELGDVLTPAAKSLCEIIQGPEALCGQSVLAAATLAVQGHADVHVDGRRHPLSEYFVSIGESGERKSAVDSHALWPVKKQQRKISEKYDAELAAFQLEHEAWKKARDEAVGGKQKGFAAKRNAVTQLAGEPAKPLHPALLCEEPTYEGLVKLLLIGQPSIGLFSDEGGRMIGGHGMNKENALKTAAGLSNLWDGKEISRVRAGDGSMILYGRRLSMHLMVQPGVSQILLSDAMLIEQGLLSRCLVTWPKSTAGLRLYREVDLYSEPAIRRYFARLLSVLRKEPPKEEGKRNELRPRLIPLASDAKRVWISFHDHNERQLTADGSLAPIRGLANKAPEHALRLAGVLALIDNLDCREIGVEHLRSGIQLIQHYLSEALRLFHSGAVDPELLRAEKHLTWAQQTDKPDETIYVYLRRIYQYGPNGIRDKRSAKQAVRILEDHGWFIPVEGGMEIEGVHRKEVWEVIKQ